MNFREVLPISVRALLAANILHCSFSECRSNQKNCICSYDAGLVKLIFVNDEVFTQNGKAHLGRAARMSFRLPPKKILVCQDGENGSSCHFIGRRNDISLCVFLLSILWMVNGVLNSAMMPEGDAERLARMLLRGIGSLQLFISNSWLIAAFCCSISNRLWAMISSNISVIALLLYRVVNCLIR